MTIEQARELYTTFGAAMAYLAVVDHQGGESIGSAFHVGEGVFVTARHVVEGRRIRKVVATQDTYITLTGEAAEDARTFVRRGDENVPSHWVHNSEPLELTEGPFFHPDDRVDVAVFRVRGLDEMTPAVPLGSHLDDWIGRNDFVLSEAIVMGYPPLPMTRTPYLVAARVEVNAVVDLVDVPYVHMVVSATPRGGFSGGLVLSEWGFALGVVSRSLLRDHAWPELGFMSLVSIEPIYVCLAEAKLLPELQAEMWDDLWNRDDQYFTDTTLTDPLQGNIHATVTVFDDGKRWYLEIGARRDEAAIRARDAAEAAMKGEATFGVENVSAGRWRFTIEESGDAAAALARGRDAAAAALEEVGFRTRLRQTSE